MDGELQKISQATGVPVEKLQEHEARRIANAQAMAEPLPGPVRSAFAPCQSIKVGPYSVRPCYDGHIEYLSLLKHPLNEMRLAAQASADGKFENLYRPQGPMAWQLCYLFTHDLDEIDEVVERGGMDALVKAAKKEFSRKRLAELVALSESCIEQYGRYWEPVLEYGEPAQETDDDEPQPSKKN